MSDRVSSMCDDPESVAAEIDRVLRPEGWICARTPNRNGYIAWGARLRHIAHLHAKAPIFARKSGMTDAGSAGLLRRSGDNRAIIQLTRSWRLLGAMNIRHTLEHST